MSDFGKIPTGDSIMNSHNNMRDEINQREIISSMQIHENLKLIWLKLKGIKEDIENVKMMYRASDIGDHKRFISEIVKGIDYNVSRGDHYLRELMEDYNLRGKTGVFDLENIKRLIANQLPLDGASHGNKVNGLVMNDQVKTNLNSSVVEKKKKVTLKLKPIGKPYKDSDREIVLANNKMDENLYIVDLTSKKVICQPSDIVDLYTDEIGSQKVAVATTKKGESYFIDTFNKKIFSGPFYHIKDVFMTRRYQDMVISQVLNDDGSRYFINILNGKKINPNEFY
jgi:hypothetical protein